MKANLDDSTARLIKRRAQQLKKARNIPHHEALDQSAALAGFSNWAHFVNRRPRSPEHVPIPPARVARRTWRNKGIPAGTLIRLKRDRTLGLVFKGEDGRIVEFYGEWGPIAATREEVSVCRDQSLAARFRPVRLYLPYGKWTCRDGTEVLFNRDYCPLWAKDRSGEVTPVNPKTWIEYVDQEFFFDDGSRPIEDRKSLSRCLAVLREWGLEGRRNSLLELLPVAISSGKIDLLKGVNY